MSILLKLGRYMTSRDIDEMRRRENNPTKTERLKDFFSGLIGYLRNLLLIPEKTENKWPY